MVDPVSILSLTAESLSICIKVISVIKTYASAAKNVRKDLISLLKRVERMRNVLGLVNSLVLQLRNTSSKAFVLEVDEHACRETMNDLWKLALDIQRKKPVFAGLQWGNQKSTAMQMIQRLEQQEDEMVNVVSIIGSAASLKTQLDVEEIKLVISKSHVQPAFEEVETVDGLPQVHDDGVDHYKPVQTWLGHILREGHSDHYLRARDELSDAAFEGRWSDVFDAMDRGKNEYGETWANAIRLKTLAKSDEMSFWTPLHQAVYNRAPLEVVERLIAAGASRTLRTRWTRYSFLDLTAAELAQDFGFSYLIPLLSPINSHPLPHTVLLALQERFHELIFSDLGDRVGKERLYLPDLQPLTEPGSEMMWFPVKFTFPNAGYMYRLDQRALIVRSYNVRAVGDVRTLRVTMSEIDEVEEAIVSS